MTPRLPALDEIDVGIGSRLYWVSNGVVVGGEVIGIPTAAGDRFAVPVRCDATGQIRLAMGAAMPTKKCAAEYHRVQMERQLADARERWVKALSEVALAKALELSL